MNLFDFSCTPPTLYDPAVHGVMTDEERHRHNQELWDQLPERDTDNMTAHFYYDCWMAQGNEYAAQKYQEGRDADLAWEELEHRLMSSILVTKKELREREKRQKQRSKTDRQLEREIGIPLRKFAEQAREQEASDPKQET